MTFTFSELWFFLLHPGETAWWLKPDASHKKSSQTGANSLFNTDFFLPSLVWTPVTGNVVFYKFWKVSQELHFCGLKQISSLRDFSLLLEEGRCSSRDTQKWWLFMLVTVWQLFCSSNEQRALAMATEAEYGSYSCTEQKNLENRYQLELTGKVQLPRSAGIYSVKEWFLFHVSFKELIGHSELLSTMVALTVLPCQVWLTVKAASGICLVPQNSLWWTPRSTVLLQQFRVCDPPSWSAAHLNWRKKKVYFVPWVFLLRHMCIGSTLSVDSMAGEDWLLRNRIWKLCPQRI